MDNQKNAAAQIAEYETKLNELNKMISEADRQLAVSKNNLEHYEETKKTLVEECEAIIADDISKLDEVFKQKTEELDSIMKRVNEINMNDLMDDANINVIHSIVNDFQIPVDAIQ